VKGERPKTNSRAHKKNHENENSTIEGTQEPIRTVEHGKDGGKSIDTD
jgi:hypothetical protein